MVDDALCEVLSASLAPRGDDLQQHPWAWAAAGVGHEPRQLAQQLQALSSWVLATHVRRACLQSSLRHDAYARAAVNALRLAQVRSAPAIRCGCANPRCAVRPGW